MNWILHALLTAAFGAVFVLHASGCATAAPDKHRLPPEKRASMLIEVANGALAENDPTGALTYLADAEKEDPKNPAIYHSRALAFHAKFDSAQAILNARHAVALQPNYSDANNTLGKLLMDAGHPQEAIVYLNRAASDPLYRDADRPLTNLGILYYRRGDFAHAGEFFQRAVQLAPARACIAYYYRGHLALRESHFRDAIKDYDQATRQLCSGFQDAQIALGIAFQQDRQFDRARKQYLDIQSRYPNTSVAEQAMAHLRELPAGSTIRPPAPPRGRE